MINGLITSVPLSLEEAAAIGEVVIRKEGTAAWKRLTGMDHVPSSSADFDKIKAKMMAKASGDLSIITNGLITKVPTSLEEAKSIGQSVVTKEGTAAWKRVTGMDHVPSTAADFDAIKSSLLDKAGGELAKLSNGLITKVPTSLKEAAAMKGST